VRIPNQSIHLCRPVGTVFGVSGDPRACLRVHTRAQFVVAFHYAHAAARTHGHLSAVRVRCRLVRVHMPSACLRASAQV
jgi:hypothetical protein